MSKAVDVKILNVLGANPARSLAEHVNIYTGGMSQPTFPFFSSFLLLFPSSLQILITQALCVALFLCLLSVTLTDQPSCCCRGTVCSEIRIVRAHACIGEVGGGEEK